MGVNVFPAPTASSGLVANLPRFTYKTSYTLTHGAGIRSFEMDTAYHPSTNTIFILTGGNQATKWTIGSGSVTTINLPLSTDADSHITVGFDGTIYFNRGNDGSSTQVYRSTDGGTNWNTCSNILYNMGNVFPLSSTVSADGNSTDVVPAAVWASSAIEYMNATTGGSVGTTLNVNVNAGSFTNTNSAAKWNYTAPIRKGDDDFYISGYLIRSGQGGDAVYSGSHGFLTNPMFSDFRGGGAFSIFNNESVKSGTNGLDNTYKPNLPGWWTAIENRWMLQSGKHGQHMYDNERGTFTGSPFGLSLSQLGYYTGRPIYVSATKKLYVPTSPSTNTLKIREFDVTFE